MGRQYLLSCAMIALICSCTTPIKAPFIQHTGGIDMVDTTQIWLSHEHLLVDFIGADLIAPETWNHDHIIRTIMPYLEEIKNAGTNYFVDATPNYLVHSSASSSTVMVKAR